MLLHVLAGLRLPELVRHLPLRSDFLTGLLGLKFRNLVGVDGKLDDISFDSADKLSIDEVMMALVARGAVLPGQLDASAFDTINGADKSAVLADDFHVFPDIRHGVLPAYGFKKRHKALPGFDPGKGRCDELPFSGFIIACFVLAAWTLTMPMANRRRLGPFLRRTVF
jgi:hypothetical protein